jgi:hypothetical protein
MTLPNGFMTQRIVSMSSQIVERVFCLEPSFFWCGCAQGEQLDQIVSVKTRSEKAID